MLLTHFCPIFPFYTPSKQSENQRFSGVFRGCRMGTLTKNGLKRPFHTHKNSSVGVRHAFNFSCIAVKFSTNISRVPGLTQDITTKSVKYKRHWKNPFRYHSNDTKRNPWVMLFSHCPINDLSIVTKQYRLPCSYITRLLAYCRG